MQRYNIFYQIHKGLRAMLYQTAGLLQQTDFNNQEEADLALAQVEQVLDLFDEHAHSEDSLVLPAIELYEPSVVTLFEEEHVEDHALGNQLRNLLNIFNAVEYAEEKNMAGSAIRFSFNEFLVFNLKHMAKEESLLNNLLWQYYTDSELHAITMKILAKLPPERMQQYNTWIMRGLSNNEIIGWLNEVKNTAPDFVFNGIYQLAQKELPLERWAAVNAGIADELITA